MAFPKVCYSLNTLCGCCTHAHGFEIRWINVVPNDTLSTMHLQDTMHYVLNHFNDLSQTWCRTWFHQVQHVPVNNIPINQSDLRG